MLTNTTIVENHVGLVKVGIMLKTLILCFYWIVISYHIKLFTRGHSCL